MPHIEMLKMPKPKLNFHIKVLDDKTFLLEGTNTKGDSFEYSYDSVDELLKDLREDLGGGGNESMKEDENEPEPEPERKEGMKLLKKITKRKSDEEDEDNEE